MNKNMMMLIGALFCANIVVFAAQKGNISAYSEVNASTVAEPLTAEENKKYQALVVEIQETEWFNPGRTPGLNLFEAFRIVEKRGRFLLQQLEKPSFLPNWLRDLLPMFLSTRKQQLQELTIIRERVWPVLIQVQYAYLGIVNKELDQMIPEWYNEPINSNH